MYIGGYSYGYGTMFMSFIIFILFILTIFASFYVSREIKKSSDFFGTLTGKELCNKMLLDKGINDVKVVLHEGKLGTEFYDPQKKIISLSEECYYSNSVSAIAIAAHETGHAIQHFEKNTFPMLRLKMARPVTFISNTGMVLLTIGMFIAFSANGSYLLAIVGLITFSSALLFQVITLPVEFNASKRALEYLYYSQVLDNSNLRLAQKVLRAAALTYIASAAYTFAIVLRYVLIIFGGDRD